MGPLIEAGDVLPLPEEGRGGPDEVKGVVGSDRRFREEVDMLIPLKRLAFLVKSAFAFCSSAIAVSRSLRVVFICKSSASTFSFALSAASFS